jgi:hypothetical protein
VVTLSELPRFVLGVDPGKTTGVALYDLLTDRMDGAELAEDEVGLWLETIISQVEPAIAIEAFVITAYTAKNSQAPWSLEVIGLTRYLAIKYGCAFEVQAQSAAKNFASDARLQALGWHRRGKGHMADAQRQVLLFLVRHGWWDDALDGKRCTE